MNSEAVQPRAASSRCVRAAMNMVVVLRRSGATATALTALFVCACDGNAAETAKITYQDHVRPIFQEHCFACHSQDGAESDLALDSYAAVMAGGLAWHTRERRIPDYTDGAPTRRRRSDSDINPPPTITSAPSQISVTTGFQ